MSREAFSPAEFDAVCRELERRCPWLSQTSGRRSVERNAAVGGSEESKHLWGMAKDYVASESGMQAGLEEARSLGLWALVHKGHLHVQGAAPGPFPSWWLAKYGKDVLAA